jgi:protein-S-isoprenylcysteine O-methyltransferase Ste14
MLIQLIAFVVGSAALIWLSRASLASRRSHGFYRFIACKLIYALFLLNVTVWFDHVLAWHQLISWVLLLSSIPPLALGVVGLTGKGKPADHREGDDTLLGFEQTTELVTTGIYHYIRHPLYCSLLLLTWGIFFKAPSWTGGLLALAASLALIATARADEGECIAYFGEQYKDYMKVTRMFLPYLF